MLIVAFSGKMIQVYYISEEYNTNACIEGLETALDTHWCSAKQSSSTQIKISFHKVLATLRWGLSSGFPVSKRRTRCLCQESMHLACLTTRSRTLSACEIIKYTLKSPTVVGLRIFISLHTSLFLPERISPPPLFVCSRASQMSLVLLTRPAACLGRDHGISNLHMQSDSAPQVCATRG